MEKETRSAIERATQRARRLLEEDFAAQLESTFDVLPSGTVAPAPGAHLTAREAKQRERIVATIAHKRAAGMTAAEAVVDYVRDAAFTTLNRFAALKMLEARGLVQECVSKGEQSSGYREFCGLAPGVALLPDGTGYRLYVESLFDELSTEIKVLFDRRDPALVLWPRRATFADLLDAFNASDLAGVWTDDETIGWVYQYFNSKEERAAMRDPRQGGSQAPRNSRELAVRNQFFTPRYVVEFLVDNTLGRTWVEMHGRGSRLVDQCRYFVRTEDDEKRTRRRKDPRDLRVLDPACGSGHFLLYAFDLLLTIYEEAWAAEEAPPSGATGRTLRDDYGDLGDLRRAAPALIVEHNLHGVDIDPRAAQIAALALWLRAQRAWKQFGVPAAERPRVSRTHMVVAEPMPGDETLVEEFAAKLNPPLLRDLFRKMVAEMRLAGELGTLLPVEQSLAGELTRAREQLVRQRHVPRAGFLPGMERPAPAQGTLDLSGIDDDEFFQEAESRLLAALREFAEGAGGMAGGAGVRRRLFAGDAAQGIALIDLLRHRFDVVLMNPPFGDPTPLCSEVLGSTQPRSKYDLGAAFVERAVALMTAGGAVGWISSRTWMASAMLGDLRREILYKRSPLSLVADLGIGVLDSALVETAACTATEGRRPEHEPVRVFRLLGSRSKQLELVSQIRGALYSSIRFDTLLGLPRAAFAYWFPERLIESLRSTLPFESNLGTAKQGLATTDDFRFLRGVWEVRHIDVGWGRRWVPFAKGGEYEPYYDDIHLVIDWQRDGAGLKDYLENQKGQAHWSRRIASADFYGRVGLTYPERTTSDFSPRPLPAGTVFSATGQAVFLHSSEDLLPYLGLSYTRLFKQLIELFVGAGDASESGSAARHYTSGIINEMPVPRFSVEDRAFAGQLVSELVRNRRHEVAADEVSVDFVRPALAGSGTTLKELREDAVGSYRRLCLRNLELAWRLEEWACRLYGLAADEADEFLSAEVCPFPTTYPRLAPNSRAQAGWDVSALVFALCEERGYRRAFTKKSYWSNRVLELTSHLEELHPEGCVDAPISIASRHLVTAEADLVMYLVGCVLGRWVPRPPIESTQPKDDVFANIAVDLPTPLVAGTAPVSVASGIAVDDAGHPCDLGSAVTKALSAALPNAGPGLVDELAEALGGADLKSWISGGLFNHHLSRYTRSRRKAPIYWQLATPSASYSVWLYAHRVTRDTFFQIQNDIVGPKLLHEQQRLASLIERAGATPSAAVRKEIGAQESFVEELRAMLDEVKRVTPLWNPDLDDGIVLVMAPLWRLVPQHKAWQKELKGKWDELVAGTYDWAHLAMHLWPERVVPKCALDRSLAIAHGLEDEFWVEGADGKWKARTTPTRPIEELVRERSSPAVKAALKGLLEAPAPGASARRAGARLRGARA